MPKTIDTLVNDIYDVVKNGAAVTDLDALQFGISLSNIIKAKLKPRDATARKLRLSMVGKPLRQAWYEYKGYPKEEMLPHTYLKFMIGDLYESILLFLAKVAGHEVTGEQTKLTVDGIDGHRDAKIDGVTVDVKSASTYSFEKFKDGSLRRNDPFGYMHQIAGYHEGDLEKTSTDVAFLAGDKQNGHITLMKVDEIELPDVKAKIAALKSACESDELPEQCYPDKEMGKSGNRQLGVNCSYCGFKAECWKNSNGGKGLRKFLYSTGPVYLTEVVLEPKVQEMKL